MKIVVATDGSRGGNAAVRFAARLAARDAAAKLILITIAAAQNASRSRSAEETSAAEILAEASSLVRSLGGGGSCVTLALRTRREIPEAISALADRVRADLVVVGSEGRDTLDEWVVGGVALRLIYVATRPVLVVRPSPRRGANSRSRAGTVRAGTRKVRSRRSPDHEQLLGNARPHRAERRSRLRDRLL